MSDDADTFADAPLSIGEARSARSQRSQDWTPREVLVKMLREHDSGEQVLEELVVTFRSAGQTGFWNACSMRTTALGLLVQAAIGIGTVGMPQ
jgi:hypothetical protein